MRMRLLNLMLMAGLFSACQVNESGSTFTGNEVIYALAQASNYPVSGTVTFKEKTDGSTVVEVDLKGTDGNVKLPVHLHLGDISVEGADVAALLSPVDATTGKSSTHLTQLADETPVTYKSLVQLEACIKIHLSDTGVERNIILAGGNIGASYAKDVSNGRIGFGTCKSE